MLEGLTRAAPLTRESFGGDGDPALNLNLVVVFPPRNPYVPGDQPEYLDTSGPDCQGLADVDGLIAASQAGDYYCPEPAEDGVDSVDNPSTGNPVCLGGSGPDDVPDGTGDPNPSIGQSLPYDLAGSTAELDLVRNILGYQTGRKAAAVSDLSASTLAPLLRGTQVMLR
jgi:hypothetical protein